MWTSAGIVTILCFYKQSDSPCLLQFRVDLERSVQARTCAECPGESGDAESNPRAEAGRPQPAPPSRPILSTQVKNPQSQSLSRSYRSNLPTSLIYIILIDQRLLTLETWCGYRYGLVWNKYLTRVFKDHRERFQCRNDRSTDTIPPLQPSSPDNPISGSLGC